MPPKPCPGTTAPGMQRSAARPPSHRLYYTSRRASALARHAGTAPSTWCAARGRGGARGLRRPFAAARVGAAPRARPETGGGAAPGAGRRERGSAGGWGSERREQPRRWMFRGAARGPPPPSPPPPAAATAARCVRRGGARLPGSAAAGSGGRPRWTMTSR